MYILKQYKEKITMDITTHNKILDVNSIRLAMGLEIECLKYNEHQMADILSNHEKYSFLAPKVDREYLGETGCEIKLPPLEIGSPYTEKFLKEFYNYLDETLGCKVKQSCGHHIHIGLRPINISQKDFFEQSIERFKQHRNFYFQCENMEMVNFEVIKDFVYRYCKHQNKISSMLPKSRRMNRMCMPISYAYLDPIKNSTNVEQLQKAIYCDEAVNDRRMNNYLTKFYSVNLNKTYISKNTIEVRQHSGTLNFNKINNFAHLMLGMFNHSYQNRVKLTNSGDVEEFTMSNIFRPRTKLFKFYEIASRPQGATVQEIMLECDINCRGSVARTVNTIKGKYRTQKAVTCLTQHSYGYENGSSQGQHDLCGYKINDGQTLTRMSLGSITTDYNVADFVYENISQDLANYFDQRIVALT